MTCIIIAKATFSQNIGELTLWLKVVAEAQKAEMSSGIGLYVTLRHCPQQTAYRVAAQSLKAPSRLNPVTRHVCRYRKFIARRCPVKAMFQNPLVFFPAYEYRLPPWAICHALCIAVIVPWHSSETFRIHIQQPAVPFIEAKSPDIEPSPGTLVRHNGVTVAPNMGDSTVVAWWNGPFSQLVYMLSPCNDSQLQEGHKQGGTLHGIIYFSALQIAVPHLPLYLHG